MNCYTARDHGLACLWGSTGLPMNVFLIFPPLDPVVTSSTRFIFQRSGSHIFEIVKEPCKAFLLTWNYTKTQARLLTQKLESSFGKWTTSVNSGRRQRLWYMRFPNRQGLSVLICLPVRQWLWGWLVLVLELSWLITEVLAPRNLSQVNQDSWSPLLHLKDLITLYSKETHSWIHRLPQRDGKEGAHIHDGCAP